MVLVEMAQVIMAQMAKEVKMAHFQYYGLGGLRGLEWGFRFGGLSLGL